MNILFPSLPRDTRHPSYRSFARLFTEPTKPNSVRRSAIDVVWFLSLSLSFSFLSLFPFALFFLAFFIRIVHRSPFPFFSPPSRDPLHLPFSFLLFSFIASASLGIVPLYLCAYQSTNRKRDAIKGADCHKRMQIVRTLHRYLKRKYWSS